MALPVATIFRVLHRPLFEMQLARRDMIAPCCFLCEGGHSRWHGGRICGIRQFNHLDQIIPINLVDKVVWVPMEVIDQLDGAGDFVMKETSADIPLSPNSPSNAGSRNPPPLCSPLSLHQVSMVSKMTTKVEGLSNDAMGVQGERADAQGLQVDGSGFGNQVD